MADARCVPPAAVHSHHGDPCGIGCSPLPRFRSRPAITCVLLPAATAPETAFLHLLLAPRARSLYSVALVHPFFLASLARGRRWFIFSLKGCAFLYLLIHNFRL